MPADNRTHDDRPRIHQEDMRFRSLRAGNRRSAAQQTADAGHDDPPVLAATIYSPADAVPARVPGGPSLPGLIVGHGAGSNRRRHAGFAAAACAAGMVVMTIDFRGHGESTGMLDGPLELDVLAAVAILRSHPLVDWSRVCYRGSSMGGFYGLRAAADVGFAALALLCPADERVLLPGLATRPTEDELSGRGLAVRIDIDSLRAYLESCETLDDAADITSPVLLVHARGDAVVPLDHSLTLAAALGGATDLVILAGGDHGSAQASPAVHERVIRWLIARTERT
jgi:dipeptidyl aminopeptidase/acylaminoacyl peptidase